MYGYTSTCCTQTYNRFKTDLRRLLPNVKDKDRPEDGQGAVFKLNVATVRPLTEVKPAEMYLSTRLTEHKRAT